MAEAPVGRDTRIGVQHEVPRGHMALASHSGSCKHGCGDQCRRQKVGLGHSSSPLDRKSQEHLASQGVRASFEPALKIGEPQGRQDSAAIPHQSGDWTGDRFIPANFTCWDRHKCRKSSIAAATDCRAGFKLAEQVPLIGAPLAAVLA